MAKREQKPFCKPCEIPTQKLDSDFGSLYFDYNDGFRLWVDNVGFVPHLRAWDDDTGSIIFDGPMKPKGDDNHYEAMTLKKYFMHISFEIIVGGEVKFHHDFDLRGKRVVVLLPEGTVGDIIAWMPACDEFQAKHGCELTVRTSAEIASVFNYDNIDIVTTDKECFVDSAYATYYVGLFAEDNKRLWNPHDYKTTPLIDVARYILGLGREELETRPALKQIWGKPSIEEKYVCIAAQATCAAKLWMNPYGWGQLVAMLKADGYRVICIDRDVATGDGITWHFMPLGAEDFTGNKPLMERAELIQHCDFFIGLSSGLAWLAWALGTPVVLISGFTHPSTEFYTPYRVINEYACNSCWNKHHFDNQDFLWCPEHKGTSRHFECTQSITAHHVMQMVKKLYKDHNLL